MTKQDLKKAFASLLIGAGISFFLTIFQGLLDFITIHAKDFTTGAGAAVYYYIKTTRC